MTVPRAKIEASLAERGRPAMWANEQESAVHSGYPADGVKFRTDLPKLEKLGFPKIMPWNGLRFIPAIDEFWRRQLDAVMAAVPESAPPTDIRSYEDTPNAGQRRAS